MENQDSRAETRLEPASGTDPSPGCADGAIAGMRPMTPFADGMAVTTQRHAGAASGEAPFPHVTTADADGGRAAGTEAILAGLDAAMRAMEATMDEKSASLVTTLNASAKDALDAASAVLTTSIDGRAEEFLSELHRTRLATREVAESLMRKLANCEAASAAVVQEFRRMHEEALACMREMSAILSAAREAPAWNGRAPAGARRTPAAASAPSAPSDGSPAARRRGWRRIPRKPRRG